MAAPTREDAARRKSMAAACAQPCSACPWRTENQGTPHPHGFYSKANLRRLWNGLKRGERMTCHPTDPAMAEFEGYEKTAERERTHECAGAQTLIQRELAYFGQAAKDVDAGRAPGPAFNLYKMRRGRAAMTRAGLAEHVSAALFGGTPFALEVRKVNIADDRVGYEPLGEFDPADVADASVRS